MGYYIDLSKITINDYRKKLEKSDLLPSRMILKEDLENHFKLLASCGIKNLADLQCVLGTKKKIQEFSVMVGLPEEYLIVLIREVNSFHPSPNKIKDFPGILKDVILKLEKEGIKDTFKLFDKIVTVKSRKAFAIITGINDRAILELTKLTDLSRIKWIGVIFARFIYDSGYDTVQKIAKSDYVKLHEIMVQINKEKKYTNCRFGLNDMKLCVNAAKDVPFDIEY